MEKEFKISYEAIVKATENGNEFKKVEEFFNENPIAARKESLNWLQNECIDFVSRNGSNTNTLEIRLLFRTGIEMDRLIVAAKIENDGIAHSDSMFPLDMIFKNLNYELEIYSKHQFDTGGMFRMSGYKAYGPILGINIQIQPTYIFEF